MCKLNAHEMQEKKNIMSLHKLKDYCMIICYKCGIKESTVLGLHITYSTCT